MYLHLPYWEFSNLKSSLIQKITRNLESNDHSSKTFPDLNTYSWSSQVSIERHTL